MLEGAKYKTKAEKTSYDKPGEDILNNAFKDRKLQIWGLEWLSLKFQEAGEEEMFDSCQRQHLFSSFINRKL